ncbi:unnamed protein product [Sphagnum jensenii]|uniref:Transmembrane protein n=2 Tax=Sphagnum jensenii TaxID=128206 RepID=A0ABP0VD86_9BRYO
MVTGDPRKQRSSPPFFSSSSVRAPALGVCRSPVVLLFAAGIFFLDFKVLLRGLPIFVCADQFLQLSLDLHFGDCGSVILDYFAVSRRSCITRICAFE